MRIDTRSLSIALSLACATFAGAQQRPPERPIGPTDARSSETFRDIAGIRALSNGAVLVNDVPGRRVLMFDDRLAGFAVVADSTSATGNAYGGRFGSLIAYRGDSSLFVDPASVSMLVLDPQGQVARVMAIPRAEDAMILGSALASPVFDGKGRLIYRAGAGFRMMGGPAGGGTVRIQGGPGAGGAPPIRPPELPDSAFVLSIDLSTRQVDTVGYIRTPKTKFEIQHDANGGMRMQSLVNPLPVVDDWTVLPDGSVAFVRGRDYHVDFVGPDGTVRSASKIPFEWQRLTEEDKVAFIDSVKAARARLGAAAPVPGAPAAGGGGAAPQMMVFTQTITGGGGGGGAPARPNQAMQAPTEVMYVPANELPDYKPPFFAGSVRADGDGNLWVRTIPTAAIPGGPVYDVISATGQLVERVQLPENRTIIGFGKGVVYMVHRDGSQATLERASIR